MALFLTVVSVCAAQQPADERLESFALQLVNSSSQQRSELVAAYPQLITVALRKELLRHGNNFFIDGKYAAALEVYRLIEKIAEQIKDTEGLAETTLNIGSIYYFQAQHDLALENYRKAQQLFASLGNRSEGGRSLLGIALTLQAQQKLPEALSYFEQALRIFEALNDRQETANALAGIGSIQYEQGKYDAATKTLLKLSTLRSDAGNLLRIAGAFYLQKEYAESLTYYERALDYANRNANTAEVISALSGAANCYYNLRDYDRALEFYTRSLETSERINDKSGVATQLQNIGNVHRARGDYGSALESYLKSLAAAEVALTKATVATTLGSIGLVRSLQGDNAQAIEYFNKSLQAFEASGDRVGMARLFSYIGNARFLQGQYDLALAAYERGLELHRATADTLNQAHLLIAIGTVYVSQEKYEPALDSFQRGLAIYETLGRKAETAEALTKLAGAYRLQGEYAKGLELANKSLSTNLPGIRLLALTEIGRLQRGLNRPDEALRAFNDAIRVQQSMRAGHEPEMQRSDVLPYLGAMDVLIGQGNAVEAFARAEEAKSELLRQIIHPGNFEVTKEMSNAEQKEEARLLGNVRSLTLQMRSVQESRPDDTTLRGRLTAARNAYDSFRKVLYAKHPQLALYRGAVAPVSLVRPFVRDDTAILEYVVSEDRVVLFAVTGYGAKAALTVKAYPLPVKPKDVTALASRFLQLLSAKDPSLVQAARDLYDLLLKPAEQQIVTKSRLIVIPDGVLWDVPFAALQPSQDQYLVDQKTLSYAISVSALTEMRKRSRLPRAPLATVLAFADPVLAPEVVERLKTIYKDLPLPQTTDTSTEIAQLRAIYGTTRSHFYTGAAARKERARSEAATHGLLHFSTRAFLDQSAPLYSFIVLSTDPNVADDGLLKLWEVTTLNSKAKVVVLANTNVAHARSQYGNALIALSWAWFVAGTPAVVLTRWQVDAGSVTEFSAELHRNLRRSTDNAEALHQSLLKLRNSKTHTPYDWSAFMILGDP